CTGGFNSRGLDATSQVLVVEDLSRGSDGLRPPGHFSLLRQRKVTKRKATRMKRPRCARVRVGPPGFLDGTSLCRRKTRAHRARDPAGLFSGPPPLHTGPRIKSKIKIKIKSRAVASGLP